MNLWETVFAVILHLITCIIYYSFGYINHNEVGSRSPNVVLISAPLRIYYSVISEQLPLIIMTRTLTNVLRTFAILSRVIGLVLTCNIFTPSHKLVL